MKFLRRHHHASHRSMVYATMRTSGRASLVTAMAYLIARGGPVPLKLVHKVDSTYGGRL